MTTPLDFLKFSLNQTLSSNPKYQNVKNNILDKVNKANLVVDNTNVEQLYHYYINMADEAVAQAVAQAAAQAAAQPASNQYSGNDDVDPYVLSRYAFNIRRGGGRFTNKKYIRRRGRSHRGRSRRGRSRRSRSHKK